MKIRFIQSCCISTTEYAEGDVKDDLSEADLKTALELKRAVPYVEPEPGPATGADPGAGTPGLT